MKEYKREFIGTTYKEYKDKKPRSKIAQEIVEKVAGESKRKAEEVKAFFVDMDGVFDESFRILKQNGRCCFVIGNTRILGVDILNAEAFAESLQYAGFTIDRIIKRKIPTKALPQKRDEKGRFVGRQDARFETYPVEYILIGKKN